MARFSAELTVLANRCPKSSEFVSGNASTLGCCYCFVADRCALKEVVDWNAVGTLWNLN